MYHVPLITLLYGLFIDIKYVKITWSETKRANSKCENLIFFIYFFNKDISLKIQSICLKF